MTFGQIRLLSLNMGRTDKDNPLHQWWKWTQMDDEARAKAREIKKRYGTF